MATVSLPEDYLVLDLETNCPIPARAYILQLGLLVVRDGAVAEELSFLFALPDDVPLDPGAVNVHGITREMSKESGGCFDAVIPSLASSISRFGLPVIGHNVLGFDLPTLNARLTERGLSGLPTDNVYDTGAIAKASLLMQHRLPGQSIEQFQRRVLARRVKGLKWNLDRCLGDAQLTKEARGNHDALEDCKLTSLLFEYQKRRGIADRVLAQTYTKG